ncbi:MAG: hypothetical protein J0L73_21520 [Verrucomicrobia bacterium]|nr:hypothetical protein [Verrucomicrobiota bacterium]
MSQISQFYVPQQALKPGKEIEVLAAKLWSLGLPFMDLPEFGDLPEDLYEIELIYEDMAIVFSEFGDPVPNQISDLRCPHCNQDVMSEAYKVWQEQGATIPTEQRTFACSGCAQQLSGKGLNSTEPFTFATCYLYVSDIDPGLWPGEEVRANIESVLGPCAEYRETEW